MRAPVRRAGLRDRQARQSLRRRDGRARCCDAYDRAYRTDPTSAFGGIIAFNRELDAATARAIVERQFVEVIAAPAVDAEAARACSPPSRTSACSALGELGADSGDDYELKSVGGGLLVQDRDAGRAGLTICKVVTQRAADARASCADLLFAWRVAKYVKSNAIVFARDGMTIGVGAGQMSRVDSTRIAAHQGGGRQARGARRRDGLGRLLPVPRRHRRRRRCTASPRSIQPGGSMRDDEVIAAADEHGMAMVFTGMRHFRH